MKLILIISFFLGLAFLLGSLYFSLKTFSPPNLTEDLIDQDSIKITKTGNYMIWVETSSFSTKPFYFKEIALLESKNNTILPVDHPDYQIKYLSRRLKFNHLLYTFNATPGRYHLVTEGEFKAKARYYLRPSINLMHFLTFILALVIGLALCVFSVLLFLVVTINS